MLNPEKIIYLFRQKILKKKYPSLSTY